jgi:hypothetical protein
MSLARTPLPDDPQALRAFAASLQAELARKDIEITARDAEIHAKTLHIEKLKMQLAALRRARFGRSSERLDRDIEQLELLIGELEEEGAESDARTPPIPHGTTPRSVPRQRASAVSRSAGPSHPICRAKPSCMNPPAPVPAAAARCSAASGRTSARCSNTSPPASR